MKSLKFLLIGAAVMGVIFYLVSEKKTTISEEPSNEKNNSIESKEISKKERMKTADELYEEQIKQVDKQQATAIIAPIDRDIIPLKLEELEKQVHTTSEPIEEDREIIPFELEALEEEILPIMDNTLIDNRIIPKELVELEKNSSINLEDASIIDEIVPEILKTMEEYGDNGSLPKTDEIPN